MNEYLVNFEDATKGSYFQGDNIVTLNGLNWELYNVLIGGLPSDWKNGDRSARLNGNNIGTLMSMKESWPYKVLKISFYYRRFGTDSSTTWKVECSVNDGETWFQVGEDFEPSEEVKRFESLLPDNNRAKIRIARSGTDEHNNRRMNVDDIRLIHYPYGYLPPPENFEINVDDIKNRKISFSWQWETLENATPQFVTGFIIEQKFEGEKWEVLSDKIKRSERNFIFYLKDEDFDKLYHYNMEMEYRIKAYWVPFEPINIDVVGE